VEHRSEHTGIKRGGFNAGRCIDISTDIFNLDRDITGRAACCPFEGHMLQQMGNPVLRRLLVA